MAATQSLKTQFVDINYKLFPEFGQSIEAVQIEDILCLGVSIESEAYPQLEENAKKMVLSHHIKRGDLKHIEPPLENEGVDWEERARQGNEANLE